MTTFRVEPDDLTDPRVVALLEEHVAQMRAISPPESVHALDLDGLRAAAVRFWAARDASGAVLGCGALKALDGLHGEVKSMRTAPNATRRGVAAAVLGVIIDAARRAGMTRLSLETGSGEFFAPAHRLYARHGFVECGPFGDYALDPESRFMRLNL
jgi:putative acetyltransferase